MGTYVARRLLQAIPLLIGVTIVGFALMQLAPGGPLALYTLNPTVNAQDIERIKHIMGLDQPMYIQYLKWAKGMLTGTWGYSFFGARPVRDIIFERVPATLTLMGTSMAFAIVIGVLIGILGAVKRYSIFDYLATTGSLLALSFPTFWFGLMAIYIFAEKLRWFPAGGMMTMGSGGDLADRLHHLALPAAVLGLVLVAEWSRYTRSSLLDVLNQDYMRTARGKGLSERVVLFGHAMRNALVPLVMLMGLQLPWLFGGALVTESVFSWPGMGRLFVDALTMRDYPILMAMVVVTAVLVILGNLFADLLAAAVDPRIRLS
jgi:peptide/nickel transport system permease protein